MLITNYEKQAYLPIIQYASMRHLWGSHRLLRLSVCDKHLVGGPDWTVAGSDRRVVVGPMGFDLLAVPAPSAACNHNRNTNCVFLVGPYAFVLVETQANQYPICCESPLDYGAERFHEVHIQANDRVILAGWYVPPRQTPGAVIVLLHGARGDRRGTAWHTQQFIQAGYGVLLYDQRALGESTGDKVSFGWLDGADLLAVIDYLSNRPEVDPERIGVVGLSGGGPEGAKTPSRTTLFEQ